MQACVRIDFMKYFLYVDLDKYMKIVVNTEIVF